METKKNDYSFDDELKAIDHYIIPELEKIIANDKDAKTLKVHIAGPKPSIPGESQPFYGPFRITPGKDGKLAKKLMDCVQLRRTLLLYALAIAGVNEKK